MKLLFLSKRHELDTVYYFQFQPTEPVKWTAGQSIRLEIDGHERRFSIVSAPYEKHIAIATRISDSPFKHALAALESGDEIDGYNIEGTFVWDKSSTPKVLIAGGIGITAYLPMFKQVDHDNQPLEALLIYTNRDNNFLFGDELAQLRAAHSGLNVVLLTDQRLSSDTVQKYKAELSQSLVYLSGPETMVRDLTPLLLKAGVQQSSLKQDLFSGQPGWED